MKGYNMKYKFSLADVCLPYYWSGHHLAHVQIPVYHGMKLNEIKDAIRSQLSQGCVMGNTDEARLLSSDFINPNDELSADKLTKKAYAAVNRIRPAKKNTRRFFMYLDEQTYDDFWTVYAYFVFVEI